MNTTYLKTLTQSFDELQSIYNSDVEQFSALVPVMNMINETLNEDIV